MENAKNHRRENIARYLRTISLLIASTVVVGLLQIDPAEALCEQLRSQYSGAPNKQIARTNAREILAKASRSWTDAEGTCQPMSLQCELKNKGWRCLARRTCCESDGTVKECREVTARVFRVQEAHAKLVLVKDVQAEKRKLRAVLGTEKPKCRPQPVKCRKTKIKLQNAVYRDVYACSQKLNCCNR